jgi:NAD(P)-dependent dehydrogenase (short-subunit alcohol dehydrogenase family)
MTSSPPSSPPTVLELRTTLRTLAALASDRRFVADLDARHRTALLDAARLLVDKPRRAPPLPVAPTPPATTTRTTTIATTTTTTRPCYVYQRPTVVDVDALCAACRVVEQTTAVALDHAQRAQTLAGHVIVVTGGRTNIGYATALAALRLGARVLVTTRFVDDAILRYRAEPDADHWWQRLSIDALDLRDLPAIERLAARWANDVDGLDTIIHNAAQTLPLSTSTQQALLAKATTPLSLPAAETLLSAFAPLSSSAAAIVSDSNTVDDHGPYGKAPAESWRAGLADVSTRELLEVLLVNAAAPFVFTRALLPLLKRNARSPRVVVNVTSSEGRFSFSHHEPGDVDDDGFFAPRDSHLRSESSGKSHRHPHLNMAKAALNMLTRTSASELATDDVLLVGVDPGWVSGPLPVGGFATGRFPLDVDEAARRVLQPVVAAAQGQPPRRGVLYKNWRPSPW